MNRAAYLVLALAGLPSQALAGEEIYYRRDANGALVLTNVPDRPDFRAYRGHAPLNVTSSGAEYRELIERTASQHGIHPDLVFAVAAVESNFNSRAVSEKGAQGLMQLMPETASLLGVRNSFDPQQNIDGGVRHLRGLIDRFGNDLPLALAAYNAGEKAVINYRGIPPFPETRDYVTRVLHLYDGGTNGSASASSAVYRTVGDDGTIVYTNIPPRGRR
jgi:soluble lytic murein transglycosylase-like protein